MSKKKLRCHFLLNKIDINMMAVETQEQSHVIDDTHCKILVKSFCEYETPEAILL